MNRIDTVVFDWAGTTIDYGCFAPLWAFVEAFKKRRVDITLEEARKPMGMRKIDHVRALLDMPRIAELWSEQHGSTAGEADAAALYSDFEKELFPSLSRYCAPIPGVCDTVKILRSRGIKIGSGTGYTREMMDVVAPEAERLGYRPDCIVSASDVPEGRPAPYLIWQNAINLRSPNLHCVCKVGDTPSDIREGVNAGVWSVGVVVGSNEWGLQEDETNRLSAPDRRKLIDKITGTYLHAGAHFVIVEISELPGLLDLIDDRLDRGRRPS